MNNRTERALRPAVIAREVSCGNKTDRGWQTWQILTSLAVTRQQRGEDFVDCLAAQLPLAAGAGQARTQMNVAGHLTPACGDECWWIRTQLAFSSGVGAVTCATNCRQ